jgi:hypothetical protein
MKPAVNAITAADVIELLDKARIKRVVLLSVAYAFGKLGVDPTDEYGQG